MRFSCSGSTAWVPKIDVGSSKTLSSLDTNDVKKVDGSTNETRIAINAS